MAILGFADIQALTLVDEDDPLPDLCLGIIEDRKYLRLSNVLMVGKLYTPWTTSSHEMVLCYDKVALERSIGMLCLLIPTCWF